MKTFLLVNSSDQPTQLCRAVIIAHDEGHARTTFINLAKHVGTPTPATVQSFDLGTVTNIPGDPEWFSNGAFVMVHNARYSKKEVPSEPTTQPPASDGAAPSEQGTGSGGSGDAGGDAANPKRSGRGGKGRQQPAAAPVVSPSGDQATAEPPL